MPLVSQRWIMKSKYAIDVIKYLDFSIHRLELGFTDRRCCSSPFIRIAPCILANSFFPSCSTTCPCTPSGIACAAIAAITSSGPSTASSSTFAWPLASWPVGRAYATSRPVHGFESYFHQRQESEANLLGVVYDERGIMTAAPYEVVDDRHWVFEGTDLKRGDLFGTECLH